VYFQRPFTVALAQSSTLRTLVDTSDPHGTHSPKVALTRDNIKHMMRNVRTLKKVECDGRIWTVSTSPIVKLSLISISGIVCDSDAAQSRPTKKYAYPLRGVKQHRRTIGSRWTFRMVQSRTPFDGYLSCLPVLSQCFIVGAHLSMATDRSEQLIPLVSGRKVDRGCELNPRLLRWLRQ
jgi:hypothetical protein